MKYSHVRPWDSYDLIFLLVEETIGEQEISLSGGIPVLFFVHLLYRYAKNVIISWTGKNPVNCIVSPKQTEYRTVLSEKDP